MIPPLINSLRTWSLTDNPSDGDLNACPPIPIMTTWMCVYIFSIWTHGCVSTYSQDEKYGCQVKHIDALFTSSQSDCLDECPSTSKIAMWAHSQEECTDTFCPLQAEYIQTWLYIPLLIRYLDRDLQENLLQLRTSLPLAEIQANGFPWSLNSVNKILRLI